MDPNQLPTLGAVTQHTSFYKNKRVIILLIILFTILFQIAYGWILLNFFSSKTPQNTTQISSEPQTNSQKSLMEDELPLRLSILKNPMIYEWRGSIEGKLVDKTDTTFTLEKDSSRITVTIKKDYTAFNKTPPGIKVQFTDIALNTFMRGAILLPPKDGLAMTGVKGDIVGEIFFIEPSQ